MRTKATKRIRNRDTHNKALVPNRISDDHSRSTLKTLEHRSKNEAAADAIQLSIETVFTDYAIKCIGSETLHNLLVFMATNNKIPKFIHRLWNLPDTVKKQLHIASTKSDVELTTVLNKHLDGVFLYPLSISPPFFLSKEYLSEPYFSNKIIFVSSTDTFYCVNPYHVPNNVMDIASVTVERVVLPQYAENYTKKCSLIAYEVTIILT